jgi:predicted RNA-binding protein associated with RNAse of E/G family
MTDYRAEWLSDILIERATWKATAEPLMLDGLRNPVQIAGPGYVWVRFWFRAEGYLVEKYLRPTAEPVGMFAPVCYSLEQRSQQMAAKTLILALWFDSQGKVYVLGEDNYELAAEQGGLTPVELEQGEHRVREMTQATVSRRFPPAFARNFTLETPGERRANHR